MALIASSAQYFDWQHLILTSVAGALCFLLVSLAPSIPRLTGSPSALKALQASHKLPTPRVGGVAVFGALVFSTFFAPADLSLNYALFLAAAALLFFVGLVEDLGFGVSPAKRLLAALLTSLLVIFLFGGWIPRFGVAPLDWVMTYGIVGIPITLLVTAGVANAFNLIDGVNGLAAVTATVAAIAMAAISRQAGYESMVVLTTLLVACILGFLIFNFPFGKIFLGDAGAYTLGFVLSWFAIAIMINVPQATPWALLLTLFWPIADMCLAIYRRQSKKSDKMAPDRLHVHQLVMRALEIHVLGRGMRQVANPLSTVVLTPFVAAPAVAGVVLWDHPRAAILAVIGFSVLFFLSYVSAFPLLKAFQRKSACKQQSAMAPAE
ncbi:MULTISPECIES: MraY family glycosyltransferase [unclassified Yoonia]|uniref:MraY family glycosyltransferase n=1 Tax=unclassified Yoonia TaxID=2629118 RepID=UPI002AFF7C88|nr:MULTISPECIES: MraY family glycosyltransferase [unclassified Yoonia]